MPRFGDSSPYLYGSSFSNHSSLITTIGPSRLNSPLVSRFSPHLSTISESPLNHVRRYSPVIRTASKPKKIDTLEIDVSTPRIMSHTHNHGRSGLRRDRATVRIRSQALKDNPALRSLNEKHEKTVGELLVEKFFIKEKKETDRTKKVQSHPHDDLNQEEQDAAIRGRVTRRLTRRRSSLEMPTDTEQLAREFALALVQAEVLDNLVEQEQAEIQAEALRGTLIKRRESLPVNLTNITQNENSESISFEDEDTRSSKRKSSKKIKKKKKNLDKKWTEARDENNTQRPQLKQTKSDGDLILRTQISADSDTDRKQTSQGKFKIEASNSVGDFSTLVVNATRTPPSPTSSVEYRESIRLPAPRYKKNQLITSTNNKNQSSDGDDDVILAMPKPYVKDATRNSVYLTLKTRTDASAMPSSRNEVKALGNFGKTTENDNVAVKLNKQPSKVSKEANSDVKQVDDAEIIANDIKRIPKQNDTSKRILNGDKKALRAKKKTDVSTPTVTHACKTEGKSVDLGTKIEQTSEGRKILEEFEETSQEKIALTASKPIAEISHLSSACSTEEARNIVNVKNESAETVEAELPESDTLKSDYRVGNNNSMGPRSLLPASQSESKHANNGEICETFSDVFDAASEVSTALPTTSEVSDIQTVVVDSQAKNSKSALATADVNTRSNSDLTSAVDSEVDFWADRQSPRNTITRSAKNRWNTNKEDIDSNVVAADVKSVNNSDAKLSLSDKDDSLFEAKINSNQNSSSTKISETIVNFAERMKDKKIPSVDIGDSAVGISSRPPCDDSSDNENNAAGGDSGKSNSQQVERKDDNSGDMLRVNKELVDETISISTSATSITKPEENVPDSGEIVENSLPTINIIRAPVVEGTNDVDANVDDSPSTPTNEWSDATMPIFKWEGQIDLSAVSDLDGEKTPTPTSSRESMELDVTPQTSKKKKFIKRKSSTGNDSDIDDDNESTKDDENKSQQALQVPQSSAKSSPKPSPKSSPRNSPKQRPIDLVRMFYTTPGPLLTATPRDLSKVRRGRRRKKHSSATSSVESSSTESVCSNQSTATESADDTGSAGLEETEKSKGEKRLTSTLSNDSGFDGSPRQKNCEMACHKKCEKLTGNLCGLNQKLVAEALQALKRAPSQHSDSQRSESLNRFQGSGRITPPATNLPRFKKYAVTDFNFLKVLGKGSFGKVLLAELRGTECLYAVKCLKKDVVLEDDDVECTLIERKVLTLATRHPYLCHLFCTFQSDSHLFFVMEYLNGGDLMFHIQRAGRFPEPRARFYAAEILSGLTFLHKKGIVYRDLKLDNVLLDFDGHIRIADFGMCKLQIYLDRTADTFCGTPDYMAPEIIKGMKYNQAVDWWSYGVLLYEMLTGQSPFSGCDEDELFWSICNERPFIPRYLSQEATDILVCLLEKDAAKRLPGHEIAVHAFFQGLSWDRLERRQLEPPFKPALEHTLDTRYFDATFTAERPRLSIVPEQILASMDQGVFRGFSYTNPNATD